MANILILGGGFGGLVAAERLAETVDGSDDITLVSPAREFTFYPGLVQFAFGQCEIDDLRFDLSAKLRDIGVRFLAGEMTRMDPVRRVVEIAGVDFNGEVAYDYLIIAMGRRLATERVPGFFEYSHHLLGRKAAEKFGAAINKFREGDIVLGLCPDARLPVPVCEAAFALARKFSEEMKADRVRIKVIFPRSLEDAFGGARIHEELEAAFRQHGINVLYDIPITEITTREVLSRERHHIRYDLLMLVPPFRGNHAFSTFGVTDSNDFIKVDRFMRVERLPHTYSVGDIVAFDGPKFAHMAVRQAEVAAQNVSAELAGEKRSSEYHHEIKTVIDAGGRDSIYLHYGLWDESLHRVRQGRIWGWAKELHDRAWKASHR